MKYYVFKNYYEYYALIAVSDSEEYPMDVAIKKYAEEIEGGMEEYNESYEFDSPTEITEEEAVEEYKKANFRGTKTDEEKVKEFYKDINEQKNDKCKLLLVDGSLL